MPTAKSVTPEAQLKGFIAKFDPKLQRQIRAVRAVLRARFPTANELVYDNYNFFVIGYCPSERPSDCLLSIAAQAKGVSLCFTHGKKLPDPGQVLHGQGHQTRFLSVPDVETLKTPAVQALFDAAVAQSKTPFLKTGGGRLIIRSVSAKQRLRR